MVLFGKTTNVIDDRFSTTEIGPGSAHGKTARPTHTHKGTHTQHIATRALRKSIVNLDKGSGGGGGGTRGARQRPHTHTHTHGHPRPAGPDGSGADGGERTSGAEGRLTRRRRRGGHRKIVTGRRHAHCEFLCPGCISFIRPQRARAPVQLIPGEGGW